jgi:hypothetical protein
LLKPSVKCTPTQTERFSGFPRVSIVSREGFLDEKGLNLFKTHRFEAARIASARR